MSTAEAALFDTVTLTKSDDTAFKPALTPVKLNTTTVVKFNDKGVAPILLTKLPGNVTVQAEVTGAKTPAIDTCVTPTTLSEAKANPPTPAPPPALGKTTTSQPTAALPSPKAGAKVTLTATVTAADGKGTPTGTANFLSDGKSVGSAKLDNKGTATLPLEKGLTAASHSITAVYQGDKAMTRQLQLPLR